MYINTQKWRKLENALVLVEAMLDRLALRFFSRTRRRVAHQYVKESCKFGGNIKLYTFSMNQVHHQAICEAPSHGDVVNNVNSNHKQVYYQLGTTNLGIFLRDEAFHEWSITIRPSCRMKEYVQES